MIGPNGAGKTTVFNLLTGLARPDSGAVEFFGKSITRIPPFHAVSLGMARTFQTSSLHKPHGPEERPGPRTGADRIRAVCGIFQSRKYREAEEAAVEKAMRLARFFHLSLKADQPAASLPYGEQRRLELVRRPCGGPKLLLIDEPGAGMNPQRSGVTEDIREVKKTFGLTVSSSSIRWAYHDLSDRLAVLDFGEKIAEGTPEEIDKRPKGDRAYLGKNSHATRHWRSPRLLRPCYGPRRRHPGGAQGGSPFPIGANGAGKSTLLRTVAGILKPLSGSIEFAGRSITRQRPDRIVRLGISMVPEGRQISPISR